MEPVPAITVGKSVIILSYVVFEDLSTIENADGISTSEKENSIKGFVLLYQ